MSKRPNIIIFNPDQMRTDALAHMGNPASLTPFLDEFAQTDAVSFRRAFCQNTVCVPSRCSFLTGLYPHVHGHRTMSHLLRPGEPSLFSELKEAGYHVWMNGRNDLVAGQYPGLVDSHADEIFYYDENTQPAPRSRHQDDKFPYSHYVGRTASPEFGDDDDVNAAIRRILNPVNDKPLCLFLGLMNPHPPYQAEDPFYSAIDRHKLPPRIKPDETSGKPLMEGKIRDMQKLGDYTEEQWTELRATYLAMCCKVDDMFRRLCDALKQVGEYDNSAIFFFSDHGDYTGDFGIAEKSQNTFEDCLTNVPLLVKPPKGMPIDPGISDSLVELVDFYSTAMDYAGVKPSHDHFGHHLQPVLADRSAPFRQYAFCEGGRMPYEEHCDEYHANGLSPQATGNVYWPRLTVQLDPVAHAKGTMIRSQRYKYIRRVAGQDEFYDLQTDPGERHNQIDNQQYAAEINELRLAMLGWYQETCDVVPYDYDRRFAPEKIWGMVRGACPPEHKEEVMAFIRKTGNLTATFGLVQKLAKS